MQSWSIKPIKQLIFAVIFVSSNIIAFEATADELARLSFPDKPALMNTPRLGLNLGSWTAYGSEQIMSNVLKNPGFEGTIDRILIQTHSSSLNNIEDDDPWQGASDHFWDNANFEVLTGRAIGSHGRVTSSLRRDNNNLPQYTLDRTLPDLNTGDAIVLSRSQLPSKPANWWVAKDNEPFVSLSSKDLRPGSPGQSSLRLSMKTGARTEIYSFLDTMGAPYGRLMPVHGKWRFSIWLKAINGTSDVRLSLYRGHTRLFEQVVIPSQIWHEYRVDFSANEAATSGENPSLQLTISAGGIGAEVAVDDAYLGPDTTQAFRPEVISMLKQLQPGYLRDWQGQLGDTMSNRLASPWQRQTSRYHWQEDGNFLYGLDEFVNLCSQVHAMPWIIIPSTITDTELPLLSDFIRKQQARYQFTRWVLEFGNENWNPLFRPAALVNDTTHAIRTQRIFSLLGNSLSGIPTQFLINIQPANAGRSMPEAHTAHITGAALAVAPYYFRSLNTGATDEQVLQELFPDDEERFLQQFKSLDTAPLWLYEYNLHTDGGNAGFAERQRATAGLASGISLANRALAFYRQGVVNHAIYTMSQIAGFVREKPVDGTRLMPLWGITRDFAYPTLRPTGLALALLNKGIGGAMYILSCQGIPTVACQHLSALGFVNSQGQTSVVLSNSSGSARILNIVWPGSMPLPKVWQTLGAASLWSNNENPVNNQPADVKIVRQPLILVGRTLSLKIPGYGIAVITEQQR